MPKLLDNLGLSARPVEPAHGLHPVGLNVDPVVKAKRRKRQLAHRRARTQRMINIRNNSRKGEK